jgi:hypothetical protein
VNGLGKERRNKKERTRGNIGEEKEEECVSERNEDERGEGT